MLHRVEESSSDAFGRRFDPASNATKYVSFRFIGTAITDTKHHESMDKAIQKRFALCTQSNITTRRLGDKTYRYPSLTERAL